MLNSEARLGCSKLDHFFCFVLYEAISVPKCILWAHWLDGSILLSGLFNFETRGSAFENACNQPV